MSGQLREFYYKVYAQSVPLYFLDRKRIEFTYWRMLHGLCPQAQVTCTDILSNVPRYLRLLVVPGYEF